MSYITLPVFDQTGYVVLDRYDQAQDPQEWLDIEYVDWKSSGDTRFAPLASAYGEMECNGFWHHTPPKTDKDGVWVPANVEKAPRMVARAQEPGANIGRCRVIELQPNSYADCIYNLHRDDNNRLNPEGTGWIVRGFFNLTDNPDSVMILREDRDDPSTETRIPLPAGTQAIIDTQRLWHAVWHPGTPPRYCLITSWESGPELGAYIDKYNGVPTITSLPLGADVIAAAQAEVDRRRAERLAKLAESGAVDAEVKSEA
jgi:alkylated DNA repair dioxygenase AlkB